MTFSQWFNFFLFGIYPYFAVTVMLIGSWARFDLSQYTWRTGSSQIMSKKNMRLGSNLFHLGMLGIIFGHLVGMFTPHAVYSLFVSDETKQLAAIIGGGGAGALCLIGILMLMHRRWANPRVSHTSGPGDKIIIILLLTQLLLGLSSIFISVHHIDGVYDVAFGDWAQNLAIFNPITAVQHLEGVPVLFKVHIFLGFTILLLVPFTRLIHVFSAPIWYLGRRYQIVRQGYVNSSKVQ